MTEPVLIVIPCLNEQDHLAALIECQVAEMGPSSLLIVVDGGSRDTSVDIIAHWTRRDSRVRLLPNPARLQSAGINAAVAAFGSGYRFFVRLDAHADYPPRFVERLVTTAIETQADSVVVPMLSVGRTCFQIAAATAQNSRIGAGGAAHRNGGRSGWIEHGHHALMRTEAFTRVNGYNPDFTHNEDAELDVRLARSGARLWLESDLAIHYFPRSDPRALFRQYVNYGRGRIRTIRLHGAGVRLRQALPAVVAPAVLIGLVGAALSIAVDPLFLLLTGPASLWIAATLAGGVAAAIRSKAPPCGYGAGPAAMIMHLGWSIGFLRGTFAARSPPR